MLKSFSVGGGSSGRNVKLHRGLYPVDPSNPDKPVRGYLRTDFEDSWTRYPDASPSDSIGYSGYKPPAPHDNGTQSVTDNSEVPTVQPMDQIVSVPRHWAGE